MEREEVLTYLIDLAKRAGIRVRIVKPTAPEEIYPFPQSGLCQVKGETWLVLVHGDSTEGHVVAVASALRRYAPQLIEGHYVPPVVREVLDAARPAG